MVSLSATHDAADSSTRTETTTRALEAQLAIMIWVSGSRMASAVVLVVTGKLRIQHLKMKSKITNLIGWYRGQRIGTDYFMGALNSENIHILLHEIGHSFALDGKQLDPNRCTGS